MATLWIREFSATAEARSKASLNAPAGPISVQQEPGVDQTPVTFTTSAQSAAFGDTTYFIEILGSVNFHYVIGLNPTATQDMLPQPAWQSKVIGVSPGQKLAVIAAA